MCVSTASVDKLARETVGKTHTGGEIVRGIAESRTPCAAGQGYGSRPSGHPSDDPLRPASVVLELRPVARDAHQLGSVAKNLQSSDPEPLQKLHGQRRQCVTSSTMLVDTGPTSTGRELLAQFRKGTPQRSVFTVSVQQFLARPGWSWIQSDPGLAQFNE